VKRCLVKKSENFLVFRLKLKTGVRFVSASAE